MTEIEIPHQLGVAAARARVDSGKEQLKQQFGQYASISKEEWIGDRFDVKVSAMGASVSGTVEVHDDRVLLRFELPFLLRVFSKQVDTYLRDEGVKFFATRA